MTESHVKAPTKIKPKTCDKCLFIRQYQYGKSKRLRSTCFLTGNRVNPLMHSCPLGQVPS